MAVKPAVLIATAALIAAMPAAAQRDTAAQAHFDRGRALYERDDDSGEAMRQAEKEFRNAVRLDSRYAAATAYLGLIAAANRKPAEAAALYRKALAWDRNCAEAYVGLGRLRMEDGNRDLALAEYRRAVSADPNNILARRVLAEALTTTGAQPAAAELREAIECWQTLIRLDRNDREAHHELAQDYKKLSQWPEAEGELREVLRIGQLPDDIVAWVYSVHSELAQVLEKQGRIDEALREYQALIDSPGAADDEINSAKERIESLQKPVGRR